MTDSVVHIAGLECRVGDQVRQRCAWCGAILTDMDLARTAVALPRCPNGGDGCVDDPACHGDGYHDADPIGCWPVGGLVEVSGAGCVMSTVEAEASEDPDAVEGRLPSNACGQLPHEVTGSRGPL